jgi:hypothetical protein
LPARVGIADDASEPDRKETPMSRLMLVVEFEVKPERR